MAVNLRVPELLADHLRHIQSRQSLKKKDKKNRSNKDVISLNSTHQAKEANKQTNCLGESHS